MTGAGGFLGWHTRAALQEAGVAAAGIRMGHDFNLGSAAAAVGACERLIHIAGVNRASETEIEQGNTQFAEQIARALRHAETPPKTVVFANSTQADNGSVYGEAKRRAAEILAIAAEEVGVDFVDVRLPNLFGEHGKPFYNAVTSTFSHLLAEGTRPTVENDRTLTLLHAQDAADVLIGAVRLERLERLTVDESVSGLLHRLTAFSKTYRAGEIPDVSARFDRNLFNTYRSFTFPNSAPIPLIRHADARGAFFEIIRTHGGPGQFSFSTTAPGITRGDHFHRRKIERFTVLQGSARISLRRLFSEEVISFDVSGENPTAVDMPTMWAHSITNIGDEPLYTSFWTNDIFDPRNPDTIAEAV
jgi:UDP-2-acetamido-2,6-beta-L-arabino-hexul-4-ose reductase